MEYRILGQPFCAVEVKLEAGESMNCQKGAMAWMTSNMVMETKGGGLGKMFSRAFSGESMFMNTYRAEKQSGLISFAMTAPGTILPVQITPSRSIIAQKSAYLASEPGISMSIAFQKKLGSGFFGGEGFIMQKLSGNGIALVEFDGHIETYELGYVESMIIDTGYLAAMSGSCSIEIESVPGIKNKFLGGEGLFNTKVTGPGKIYLQTMPISSVASSIRPFIPTGN